jgi:hypothetical protein
MRNALYLDDLSVGQQFVTGSHTLDGAQIKAFAAQSDPQPFQSRSDPVRPVRSQCRNPSEASSLPLREGRRTAGRAHRTMQLTLEGCPLLDEQRCMKNVALDVACILEVHTLSLD